MAYYLRAFCRSSALPSPRQAVAFAARGGTELRVEDEEGAWPQFMVVGAEDRRLLIVEANYADDPDSQFEDELDEFLELLEDAPDSAAKDFVREHLEQSRAIVAVQILGGGGGGDEALAAASPLLTALAERCDGLVQADGEGFYDRDKLILPLE